MLLEKAMPLLILILIALGVLGLKKVLSTETEPETPESASAFKTSTVVARVLGYRDLIDELSNVANIPPPLTAAVIQWESGGKADAIEYKSGRPLSYGLMQVQHTTAMDMGMPVYSSASELLQPKMAILYGTRYLRWLLNRYNGNLQYAVSAYNQGPGNLEKYGITNSKYVNGVLALYSQYTALWQGGRITSGAGREF